MHVRGEPVTVGRIVQLTSENNELQRQINNYLTFGQGGANFRESQLLDKLSVAEQERDQLKDAVVKMGSIIRGAICYCSHNDMDYMYDALIDALEELKMDVDQVVKIKGWYDYMEETLVKN
jgi:hypothetical protein